MVLFQDELEALEALCFLSTGQVPDVQVSPKASNAPGSKRSQQHGRQSKQPHMKSKQQKRQQPLRKAHTRLSPGSETSSGATQCGLATAQAAELQLLPELPMAVDDIHPAAIASPEVAQLLQQSLLTQKMQQQDKQQHAAESSDTRLLVSALTPMPSDDYAEQSRQCTPGSQVVPASPEPQQLDVVAATAGPAAARTAPQPGQSPVVQQPEQQVPVISKPPVKGCFWHVYIAKMIQKDQQRKEKQQKGKQQQQASPSKRPQQEAAPGVGAAASVKKRRTEQQQQAGKATTAAFTPTGVASMSAAQQQAAAVQHVLVQTLLQQQQTSAGAGGPALLGQQAPGVLQLLQALTAAGGMGPVAQLPAPPPASPLDLLSGLTPVVAAAAAGCPQLLQALGAAAGGRQAPFAVPAFTAVSSAPAASRFSAAATAASRPLTSLMGSGTHGATYMGLLPAAPAVAIPHMGQMQAMFGQLPGFMGVPAVAAAPGYGQFNAVLGVTGVQPLAFPGRVAV